MRSGDEKKREPIGEPTVRKSQIGTIDLNPKNRGKGRKWKTKEGHNWLGNCTDT